MWPQTTEWDGLIAQDGSYLVKVGREEGLPSGEYLVSVVANEESTPNKNPSLPPIPGKPITPRWLNHNGFSELGTFDNQGTPLDTSDGLGGTVLDTDPGPGEFLITRYDFDTADLAAWALLFGSQGRGLQGSRIAASAATVPEPTAAVLSLIGIFTTAWMALATDRSKRFRCRGNSIVLIV